MDTVDRDMLRGVGPGVRLIMGERLRQMEQEGWTPEHDDEHDDFDLSRAAACYITQARVQHPGYGVLDQPPGWPWEPQAWKPSGDPIRDLVKAGALIAAEIDRLQRVREEAA